MKYKKPSTALFLWGSGYTALSGIYTHFSKKFFHSEDHFDTFEDLLSFISKNQIDIVVIQNPYINEKRLQLYIQMKQKNIDLLISDRGALPNSWFFDPHGFNAESSSYDPIHWDKELSDAKAKRVQHYIDNEINNDTALEKQASRMGAQGLREKLKIPENKKVLFVPLQRPTDTVIKYFSGNVSSMDHFLQEIIKTQKSLEQEWIVLVKKHPLEVEKKYADDLFYVEDDTHFKDLIELCDAIALINSGVGVTAMMYEKPLFHFGKAFYSHPAINKELQDHKQLIEHLKGELYQVDSTKVKRFISYLIEDFYSFGNFLTKERIEKDGSKMTITSKIEFTQFNGFAKNSSKKTLLVTDIEFYKKDIGNRQRILRLIQYLDQYIDVTVLLLRPLSKDAIHKLKEMDLLHLITSIEDIKISKKDFENAKAKPTQHLEDFFDLETKLKFDKYLQSNSFDNIIIEYIRLDYLVNDHHHKYKTFLDTHDLMSLRTEVYEKNNEKHFITLTRDQEFAILKNYAYTLSIQKNEHALISKHIAKEKSLLVYHANDIAKERHINEDLKNIIFISGPANYKHIFWFIQNVWVYFVDDPLMILNIHGSVCKQLEQFSHINNIKLHGYAKDLDKIYTQADLAINPVQYGGGLKIKNVEALCAGLPLITTDEGANGIEDGINYAFLLANSVEEWVRSLVSLKLSKPLRNKLSQNALKYSEYYFSDEHCYGNLVDILEADDE